MRCRFAMTAFAIFMTAVSLRAQPPQAPWRGAGAQPCVGSDGGSYQCPPAPRVVAVRAGRLFDSVAGRMLTRQVVLVLGDRITAIGPESRVSLRAGFTAARDMSSHGNGYGDVALRDAINQGRIDGPRLQVSTLGIVWGAAPATTPPNPSASTVVRSVEEARAAVREQIERGADWIKLYPAGNYSFTATGEAQYVVTYP